MNTILANSSCDCIHGEYVYHMKGERDCGTSSVRDFVGQPRERHDSLDSNGGERSGRTSKPSLVWRGAPFLNTYLHTHLQRPLDPALAGKPRSTPLRICRAD